LKVNLGERFRKKKSSRHSGSSKKKKTKENHESKPTRKVPRKNNSPKIASVQSQQGFEKFSRYHVKL